MSKEALKDMCAEYGKQNKQFDYNLRESAESAEEMMVRR